MGEKVTAPEWLRHCLAESASTTAGVRFNRARKRTIAKVHRPGQAWLLVTERRGLWALEAVVKNTPEGERLVLEWERALELDGDILAKERGE